MLANPRVPWQFKVPPLVRFSVLAVFVGLLAYYTFYLGERNRPLAAPEPEVAITVAVPQVDERIVALAKDETREQRLVIDAEPLRHLLEKAIDVSPAAALALGVPDQPIPVEEVRNNRDQLRGRWIWYKGVLEELSAARKGHPVKNYSIYEATIRLPDEERVFCTFSIPPPAEVRRGGIVRVEGFLMKLRDTTYPQNINEAPMLVGRQIQRDYADWPPVTEFDPALLAGINDTDEFPGAKIWHKIEDDQWTPLWHLAAYARDTAGDRTLEDWRTEPVLDAAHIHPKLVAGTIARGTPIRILGTLVKRRSIVAAANPAGIDYWTVAYLQSLDYAGIVVPIWVPKRLADLTLRTDFEVRGYYYRWYAYESLDGVHRRTPLFVAADLHRYDIGTETTMQALGLGIGTALIVMILMILIMQWRGRRDADRHSRDMDKRRRRNREREAAVQTAVQGTPPATP